MTSRFKACTPQNQLGRIASRPLCKGCGLAFSGVYSPAMAEQCQAWRRAVAILDGAQRPQMAPHGDTKREAQRVVKMPRCGKNKRCAVTFSAVAQRCDRALRGSQKRHGHALCARTAVRKVTVSEKTGRLLSTTLPRFFI